MGDEEISLGLAALVVIGSVMTRCTAKKKTRWMLLFPSTLLFSSQPLQYPQCNRRKHFLAGDTAGPELEHGSMSDTTPDGFDSVAYLLRRELLHTGERES